MNQQQEEQIVKEWQENPQSFLKDHWPDIYLWDKLQEIITAIQQHRRVVIPSGHGVGKTWITARIILAFLFSNYPAKVITTAPTWNQVEKLLWAEIATAYNTSVIPLGGKLLLTSLKISDDWFAIGFSTKPDAQEKDFGASSFQGFHSPNLLVALDEAAGVEHAIWLAADSLVTGGNNRIVAIGNPTSPSGDFYEACKSPLWKKVEISSLDHPNVRTGQIIVPGAVTKDWVDERRNEWGEESPLWKAKVLGKFPDEGTDTLIPLSWAESCVGLGLSREGLKKLGIDVARYGDDKTAFAKIFGKVLLPIETAQKKDTNYTTGRAKRIISDEGIDITGVDDTGVGGGVTDSLEDEEYEVEAFNNGEAAIESDKFENKGAEMWWNVREAIKLKDIELPNDPELINQLCSRKYSITRKGRIKIESKDDLKKRGLKSPDRADAFIIAYNAGLISDGPDIDIFDVGGEEE